MKYSVFFIIFIALFSCKPTKQDNYTTYFGGEIINPRGNTILLLKDDKVIDTIPLDSKHRFLASYQNLAEGLYTFKHGLEFQYVYFEPADSVLVRLNTWDFDESLVFSGRGGTKNEFLINLFLQNEKEEKKMFRYFSLDEADFENKIDSLADEREKLFAAFTKANDLTVSDGFNKLTHTAIHYPLYRLKEIYPYYYKKNHQLSTFPNLSKDFYAYRNNINLNETDLLSFYPYQNYVVNYLYNLSYQLKEKDPSKNDITLNVLNLTVENIKAEDIKNTLLKRIIVNDFMKSEPTCTIDNEKLNIFLENCTDTAYVAQVTNLVNDTKFVKNDKPLQNFDIISYQNKPLSIEDIIENKNTVIYFWSTEYMSSDYLVSRIKHLERNYPKLLFVGIQMPPAYLDIANEPKLKTFDPNTQFKLPAKSYANNFLTSRYPRIITVNKKGIVVNSFTYLDASKLGAELNKLELN